LDIFKQIIDLDSLLEIEELPRGYKKHLEQRTLQEYIDIISLHLDIEKPNFAMASLSLDGFLWWIK
jgi:hypothetical protein